MENGLQRGVGSVVGEIGRTGQVAPVQTNTDLMKFATASANLTKALGGKTMELAQAKQADLEKENKGVYLSELKYNLIKTTNQREEEYAKTGKLDLAQMDFDTEEAMRYIDGAKYLSDREKEQLKLDHRGFREQAKSALIQKDIVYQKELNITTTLVGLDDTLNLMTTSMQEGNSEKTHVLFNQYKDRLFTLKELDPIKYNDKVVKDALASGVVKVIGGALNRDLDDLYVKVTNGEIDAEEFNQLRKQYINEYYSSDQAIKGFFKNNDIMEEEYVDQIQKQLSPMLNQIGAKYESLGIRESKITLADKKKAEQDATTGFLSYGDDNITIAVEQKDKHGNIISVQNRQSNPDVYERIYVSSVKLNRNTGGTSPVISFPEKAGLEGMDSAVEKYYFENGIQSLNGQSDLTRGYEMTKNMNNIADITSTLVRNEGYGTRGKFVNNVTRVEYAEKGIVPLYGDVFNKETRNNVEKDYVMFEETIFNSRFRDKGKRFVSLSLNKMKESYLIKGGTAHRKANSELTGNINQLESLRERAVTPLEKKSYNSMLNSLETYANIIINERINELGDNEDITAKIKKFNSDPSDYLTADDINKINKYSNTLIEIHAQNKGSSVDKINNVVYNKPAEVETIKPTDYIDSVVNAKGNFTTVLLSDGGKSTKMTASQRDFLSKQTFLIDTDEKNMKFVGYDYNGEQGRMGVNFMDEDGKVKNLDVLYDAVNKKSYVDVSGELREVSQLGIIKTQEPTEEGETLAINPSEVVEYNGRQYEIIVKDDGEYIKIDGVLTNINDLEAQ